MKKWEYKRVFGNITENTLNEAGKHGWELVAVEPNENPMLRTLYFKRVIQEEQL